MVHGTLRNMNIWYWVLMYVRTRILIRYRYCFEQTTQIIRVYASLLLTHHHSPSVESGECGVITWMAAYIPNTRESAYRYWQCNHKYRFDNQPSDSRISIRYIDIAINSGGTLLRWDAWEWNNNKRRINSESGRILWNNTRTEFNLVWCSVFNSESRTMLWNQRGSILESSST